MHLLSRYACDKINVTNKLGVLMKRNRYMEYQATKEEKLRKLYQVIGFELKDEKIALTALTCSNFAKEYNDCSSDRIYEHDGLAVVGDAILKAVLSIAYFTPEITEGDLTDIKKNIECNAVLQELGNKMDLPHILFSSNTDLLGKKKIATAVEAVIGAIYFSHGFDACKAFIEEKIIAKKSE